MATCLDAENKGIATILEQESGPHGQIGHDVKDYGHAEKINLFFDQRLVVLILISWLRLVSWPHIQGCDAAHSRHVAPNT